MARHQPRLRLQVPLLCRARARRLLLALPGLGAARHHRAPSREPSPAGHCLLGSTVRREPAMARGVPRRHRAARAADHVLVRDPRRPHVARDHRAVQALPLRGRLRARHRQPDDGRAHAQGGERARLSCARAKHPRARQRRRATPRRLHCLQLPGRDARHRARDAGVHRRPRCQPRTHERLAVMPDLLHPAGHPCLLAHGRERRRLRDGDQEPDLVEGTRRSPRTRDRCVAKRRLARP